MSTTEHVTSTSSWSTGSEGGDGRPRREARAVAVVWSEGRASCPAGCPELADLAAAPTTSVAGKGSHVWDIDGNDYVDYHDGYGAMVMGHAHRRSSRPCSDGSETARTSRADEDALLVARTWRSGPASSTGGSALGHRGRRWTSAG